MRIVVLNTHSVSNTGDAAISLAEISLLREHFGEPLISVTSRTPDLDRPFYEPLGVGVLPPMFAAPAVFRNLPQRVSGVVRGLLTVSPKRELARAIRRADLVVSSGGGYFFSTRRYLPGPMFWQAYLNVRLAQRACRPVIFAPQSFGPLANRCAGRLLRRLLSDPAVRRVLVREETSLALVHRLLGETPQRDRVALCPDLAFLLEPPPGERTVQPLPRPVLGVTVRDWLFPDRGERTRGAARASYLDTVAGACVAFHRRTGGSISVLAHSRGPGALEDDRAISSDLVALVGADVPSSHLSSTDLPEDATPHLVMATIQGVDLVLASRFHSAILAMVSGVPAVALGYQPKSLGMMRMVGLDRFCVTMEGLEVSPLAALLDEMVAHRSRIVAEEVKPAVEAMRAAIRTRMHKTLEPFRAS